MHSDSELLSFLRTHSVREGGQVTLASGAASDFYVDGKSTTLHPEGARLIASRILDRLEHLDIDATAGMSIGGAPMVTAVAYASGRYPGLVVRKEQKGYGLQRRVEGPWKQGMRVAVLEDVVTSGGSLLQAVDILKEEGLFPVVAIAIVDRQQGGRERIEAAGLAFHALATRSDLVDASERG